MHSAIELIVLLVSIVYNFASTEWDCVYPTNNDITKLISNVIRTGDSSSIAEITLISFRPVCLAYGVQRNRYRGVSVIAQYICSGNAICQSGTALEQFESSCYDGNWSHIVHGSTVDTWTRRPPANFSTELREDCAFCFSSSLAHNIGLANTPYDETHCVGKSIRVIEHDLSPYLLPF